MWFNPDLNSRNYFVPGVVANIIMMVTLMLTAMAIVREKEIGTMEQLMVTPIRPIELMLGKTLPFAVVGLVDVVLVTARRAADVPRSVPRQLCCCCSLRSLFLMTSLGAGLFLSTISQTQQQAMMSTFLFFQPCFMLSGFAFPIRNMPDGGAVADISESAAVLHRNRARDFLEGRGVDRAVAADAGAGGLRRWRFSE